MEGAAGATRFSVHFHSVRFHILVSARIEREAALNTAVRQDGFGAEPVLTGRNRAKTCTACDEQIRYSFASRSLWRDGEMPTPAATAARCLREFRRS